MIECGQSRGHLYRKQTFYGPSFLAQCCDYCDNNAYCIERMSSLKAVETNESDMIKGIIHLWSFYLNV